MTQLSAHTCDTLPKMNLGSERTLAVFVDFENLALGFQKSTDNKKFEIKIQSWSN